MNELNTGYLLADFFRYFAHEYVGGTVAIRDVSGYATSDPQFASEFHSGRAPQSSPGATGAAASYLFIDNPFEIGKDVANVEVSLMRSIQKELRRAAHLLWEHDVDEVEG